MQVKDIYVNVAQLGFADNIDSDNAFVFALNNAISQINLLRPQKEYVTINHNCLKNQARQEASNIFYAEKAKAYYLEVCGNATAIFEAQDEAGEWVPCAKPEHFDSRSFEACKEFLKINGKFPTREVRIMFESEYVFHVRNVAMYSELFGAKEDDIPNYAEYIEYDIRALSGDKFMSFGGSPIIEDEKGNQIRDFKKINNSTIALPYDRDGVYRICYQKRVEIPLSEMYSPTECETEIPLDADLCPLLPLLVASYIWLDDESDKAQYYFNLYTARANEIVARERNVNPIKMLSVKGW